MTKQYWVGEFFVDLSRNQISQTGASQTLPPKALAVLTLLAERQGTVVTYDELLDAVWPNAVVTPNTLQRSIAQLRKALGENSKAKGIIRTHSKQGYSLECDVKWQADIDNSSPAKTKEREVIEVQQDESLDTTSPVANKLKYLVALGLLVLIALLLSMGLNQNIEPSFAVRHVHYLTATDDKEFNPTYSPDGKFILFHRYPDKLCINHLWAKNATTQQEYQLTHELGTYTQHSLSNNNEHLVYIQQEDCTKPIDQNTCYRLMQIDFQAAMREPQMPTELLRCENSAIKKPIWINDTHIAMLQSDGEKWHLIRYSVNTKTTSDFYDLSDGNILTYTWSSELQRFAVIALKNDGQQYIEIVNTEGQLESSHVIRLPDNAPSHLLVYPKFIPNTEMLIFGDLTFFYTLSFDGEVTQHDAQIDGNFGGPTFSPDGKRMLLLKGRYDSDVASLSLNTESKYSVFERSTYHEDTPKYRPNSNDIAFVSEKTGREQVWLITHTDKATLDEAKIDKGNTAKKLSDFKQGSFVQDMYWDSEGTGLLVLVNSELQILFVDKPAVVKQQEYPITGLFAWNSNTNTALVNIIDKGVKRLVQMNVNTGEFQLVSDKSIVWATQSNSGEVVYQDQRNRLWRVNEVEDQLLSDLTGQLGKKQRFIIHNHTLYGVNKAYELWSYDLQTAEFNILTQMTSDTDYITDVKDGELLFTFVVASKKEIVEVEFR